MSEFASSRRTRRRSRGKDAPASMREVNYRQLKNPFPPISIFSEDEAMNMHATSLRILEELGMRVLLPEAREIFAAGGARVKDDMVHIGHDMVEAAIASAPKSFICRGGSRRRDFIMEQGSLLFQPGAGAPYATDLKRGRRPGSAQDFREYTLITQHYDVLQMLSPSVEPQDVPTHVRHYYTTRTQLELTDKLLFFYSRGRPQAVDNFEMLSIARGLTEEELKADVHAFTVINTNSPRTIDIPMAQGLIDFARYRQMPIVTPFTLMGAMAPITVAGAITLSHAEALAGITLNQLTNPGAPVCYGTFTSNVDMKSGAPAFGTPAHFQASLAAGQMARLLGLPWRSAAGSASNINDAQAANENQFGLWGCLLAGANVVMHAGGWLEGGLTVSFEKLITDIDVLNMVAELCSGRRAGVDEIGFEKALSQVNPMGHFFDAPQTMERYNTEFYDPVVHSYANFGNWSEAGSLDANTRATSIWQNIINAEPRQMLVPERVEAIAKFIERRESEGGAPPES